MSTLEELEAKNKKLSQEVDSLRRSVGTSRTTWGETTSMASAMGDVFKGVFGAGRSLISGLESVARQAEVLKNNWQEASRLGLGLGKDMFSFQAQLLSAGLTFDEYKKATQNLTAGASGLGAGMNASMKQFLDSVAQFKGSELGDRARRFGLDFQEMADLTAISTDRRIRQDRLVDGKNTELTFRVGDLSLAVAANTEVFGISRTAQLEALKKQQEDALLQQQLTASQKKQYDLVFGSLDALGLGKYGNLAVKQQGRFTSDQQVEMIAAMGASNARDFQAAIKESLEAAKSNDPKRIESANQRMEQIQESIIRYSQSDVAKNRASMTAFMEGPLKAGYEQTANIALKSAGIYQRIQDGMSLAEARELAKAEAAKAPPPPKTPGKEGELATDAVLKVERAVRDMGKDLGLAITVGAQKTGEMIAGPLKNYYDKFANTSLNDKNAPSFSSANSGFSPQVVRDVLLEIQNGTASSVGNLIYNKFVDALSTLKDLVIKRETGSPGINNFLSGGALGSMSGMFEDWGSGTMAMLHGNEAVVRPDQLVGIISKVQSNQGLLSNVQNQFTPEKITNLINTAVTSAASQQPTAANNATTSQTQISNSTLDDIKAQLMTLNNIMDSHLRNISSTADKQYSALKSLSPDLHS
jgi:hypothetical protein